MSENQMFGGSIDVTAFMDMLNKKHSAFSRSVKNNKVYANIVVWKNANPDEFGNSISIQLSSVKEKREVEKATFGKGYIGNAKIIQTQQNKPVADRDLPTQNWDAGIPVREQPTGTTYSDNPSDITEPLDDLPF
jgi:hypothetical protein